jgi:tripeptide aminopeptidase
MLDAIQLGAALAGVDVETEVSDDFAAFALDDEALPVRIAVTALREVGVEPRLEASGGGSDVNVLNERGLASVNLSVGMEDVHSPREWMPVAGLHAGRGVMDALLSVAARTPPS